METYPEYLQHHGILGMKWGKRNGPPYPLSEGQYSESEVKNMEKKAIKRHYKEDRKNGGGFVFKSSRVSTGKNYDRAVEEFEKKVLNDPKYKELSRKAFDLEKERLLSEKKYINDYDEYDNYINKDKKYIQLTNASERAQMAKEAYVKKMAKEYIDIIKEAKLKDIGLPNEKEVKQWISSRFNDFVWDENLEYNPDNFYDKWVEKEKFK